MAKFKRRTARTSCQVYLWLAPISVFALSLASPAARGQALTPAWVELGGDGKALTRIVVTNPQDCPAIQIDGASRPMGLRQPVPDGMRPACEFAIPPNAKSASVNGKALALPKPDPARVAVIGDTGCRIKGIDIQDCNHASSWPFLQVAGAVAADKPDLVIHVGDYLYRESACPGLLQGMCGGSPYGYLWDSWNADFFTPAAELLSAAPWAFTRGNHEDCNRAWLGWFYYLDPRPWEASCKPYSPPYLVKLGKFELAVMDTSATREYHVEDAQVEQFSEELQSIHPKNAWLTSHYPFWGFNPEFPSGKPVPLVAALEEAWEKAAPSGISLILSGHVHLFEYVSVDHGRPPQLMAGDGGTEMSVPIEMSMKGTHLRGASVTGSRIQQVFGYILLAKQGETWKMELKDQQRKVLVSCVVPGSSENCQSGNE